MIFWIIYFSGYVLLAAYITYIILKYERKITLKDLVCILAASTTSWIILGGIIVAYILTSGLFNKTLFRLRKWQDSIQA